MVVWAVDVRACVIGRERNEYADGESSHGGSGSRGVVKSGRYIHRHQKEG